ncbi:MAG: hypothetical protein LBE17_11195 [Treponema sp.]|jgi:hypothetical protein|nr:hypothetical protein [Treponema sp.]
MNYRFGGPGKERSISMTDKLWRRFVAGMFPRCNCGAWRIELAIAEAEPSGGEAACHVRHGELLFRQFNPEVRKDAQKNLVRNPVSSYA